MSHFTVGVIVRRPEDLEDALAKYNEQDEDYMVRDISWTREGYIRDYRTRNPETDLTDEAIWDFAREDYGPDYWDEENIYSFYNPDARWDWWVLGGRWRYQLKVRKNTPHLKDRDFFAGEPRKQRGRYRWCDAAPIKDILWSHLNRAEPERIKQMSEFIGYNNHNHEVYKCDYYKGYVYIYLAKDNEDNTYYVSLRQCASMIQMILCGWLLCYPFCPETIESER